MKQQVSTQADTEKYGVEIDTQPKLKVGRIRTLKDFLFAAVPPSEIGAKI